MGIIRFLIGTKLTPFFYGEIYFNQKARSRVKVFEPYEYSSKHSVMINALLISYGCIFKQSSKPVIKDSRVEIIKEARNQYKKY